MQLSLSLNRQVCGEAEGRVAEARVWWELAARTFGMRMERDRGILHCLKQGDCLLTVSWMLEMQFLPEEASLCPHAADDLLSQELKHSGLLSQGT